MDPNRLVKEAIAARKHAHAPYSGYPVGAALLTEDGRIVTGCNVENASSGLTVCAERTAVLKAVSEGERTIRALAVVTEDGAFPCGACRQVLQEFGADMAVYCGRPSGDFEATTLSDLLPRPFTHKP